MPKLLAYMNSIGWAACAIWAVTKKHSLILNRHNSQWCTCLRGACYMLTGGAFEFRLGVGVNYRSLAEITDIFHHFYHSSDFCCNKVFVRQTGVLELFCIIGAYATM